MSRDRQVSASTEIRRLADQVRVISDAGIHWSAEDPYQLDRFQRIRRVAAELFAAVDSRDADEIERSVFTQLTHIAPVPVVDGAVFDEAGRLLLIQRADNGLWAMPGGAIEMGETPAQAAVREVHEETGVVVETTEFIGLWDSTRCGAITPLQLYMMVFLCVPVNFGEATHPDEVLAQDWFAADALPPLSPGHDTRVPDVFQYLMNRVPFFDR
jgi:8-oxo-dGTP pyrophosphatase MutT (NUDIX family)